MRNNLVLITGYARAGKDTLADAMVTWNPRDSVKYSFAGLLKERCNDFMDICGVRNYDDQKRDFRYEDFKQSNRHFLVSAGTFIRSIDPDHWAKVIVDRCKFFEHPDTSINVIVSDWRYLNELTVAERELTSRGWRIIKVRIVTAGCEPANEEEGNSIGNIIRNVAFDRELYFAPNCESQIKSEGVNLASALGL